MELIFLDLSVSFTYLISSFLKQVSLLALGRLYSLDVFIYFWPLLHLLWIFFLFSSVNVEVSLGSAPVFFIPHLHALLKWSRLPHNFKYYLYVFQWSCMDVRVGLWRRLSAKELMLLNCGVREEMAQIKSYGVFSISVQFSSVVQSCPTLCNLMNRSTPGLPVHHHLLEFTQTHVHQVRDAIQPSQPRSSCSPPAPNPSQHQSLFQWVNTSHEVAKVLELQL